MHSAAILKKENRDLRAANEAKSKRARNLQSELGNRRHYRLRGYIEAPTASPAELDGPASQPMRRAASRYSDCNQLGPKENK